MDQTNYGFSKVVNLGYDEAIEKVTEELKKEGFGVLTEIDVKATLKKKNSMLTSSRIKYSELAILLLLINLYKQKNK